MSSCKQLMPHTWLVEFWPNTRLCRKTMGTSWAKDYIYHKVHKPLKEVRKPICMQKTYHQWVKKSVYNSILFICSNKYPYTARDNNLPCL